ncbi:hypothetical protein CDD82_5650 [Ophiocordyceps australis]|uniref:Uncharacterized protein n=1 Tax=Ophiocordyceps australis TaxID=1399860 RepID=A0A2C5ZN92_9HYPO|nr:hypothetical protein CDD82_5650 [Ophiocordyceps australis]
MSVASPSELDPDLLLHLPRLAVPRDQHELLAQKNSWAVLANPAPYGMAHVPGHVLAKLKDAHKRKNSSTKTHGNDSKNPDKGLARGNDCPIDNDALHATAASPRSLPGTPFSSWSSSPPNRSKNAPQPQPQVERSPARQIPASAQMGPPPTPVVVPDIPGSDIEELETQLPQATSQVHVAVNIAASPPKSTAMPRGKDESKFPQPAPPCAQPDGVVPSTVVHETALNTRRSAKDPARKKFKPIVFDHGPRAPRPCLETARGIPTCLKSRDAINSSKSPSSDSVVPATCAIPLPLDPLVVAVKNHTATTKYGGPASSNGQNKFGGDQRVSKVHLNSYDKFTQTYPDYVTDHSGSLDYFIKACVYIEYLRKTWPLRECYYDELIRAFSGQYVSYVQNTSPDQQPLPAIEWFSTLPGVSLYNRLVVTNDELDLILGFFPVHVAAARSIIRDVETKAVQDHDEPPKPPEKPSEKPTSEPAEKPAQMQTDNHAALINTTSSTSLAKNSSIKPPAAAHRFSTGTLLPLTPRVQNKVPKAPLTRSPELGLVSPLAVPSTAPAAPTEGRRSSVMRELRILSSQSNWTPEKEEAYRKRIRLWRMKSKSSRRRRTED